MGVGIGGGILIRCFLVVCIYLIFIGLLCRGGIWF